MNRYRFYNTMLLSCLVCLFQTPPNAMALDEAETLALLVRTIDASKKTTTRVALLRGMLDGMEGRLDVASPDGWAVLGKALRQDSNDEIRKLANRLSQIFGDQGAISEAMSLLGDANADPKQRLAALQAMVAQRHDEIGPMLLSLIDVPELQVEAIRGLSIYANKGAPKELLSRYKNLSEASKRAVVETLATRKPYAKVLVGGLKDKTVPKEHIPSYLARSLRDLLGDEFTDAFGEIPEMKQNVKKEIARYKKILTPKAIAQGDASSGRVVFKKTCGACHLMYGDGGKIGPDLTGSNRKNLDYFLLNSLDPSADVPEGYRMVLIQTTDGRVLNGVIAEENDQRIILKTVDQPRLVISKDEIENRKVSEKSMMPEGQLQQLNRNQLYDLVRYLQTTEQVELPK